MNRIIRHGQEVLTKINAVPPHRDQKIYESLAKEIARQKQIDHVNDSIIALENRLKSQKTQQCNYQ